MDGRDFDFLTRLFSTSHSRRRFLTDCAGGLAGGLLGLIGLDSAHAASCREAGRTCSEAAHCCSGYCGPKDATGRRRCACQSPTVACGGRCLNPATAYQNDPTNCGSCGRRCPTSWVCSGGICSCPAGQVEYPAGICCSPEAQSTTCTGTCGTVANNCGQSIDCGSCSPTIAITFDPVSGRPEFCLVTVYLRDFAPNATLSVQYVAKSPDGTVFLAGAPFDVTTDDNGDAVTDGLWYPNDHEFSAEVGAVTSGLQPVDCSA